MASHVRLTPKTSTNETFLLTNWHYCI